VSQRKVFIVSGPSGVGKTTIIKQLIKKMPDLRLLISMCTRKPRGSEKEGVDYYFVSEQVFEEKLKQDAFLEWCVVHNHKYGTLEKELEDTFAAGKNAILDVDVQGAKKIKKKMDKVVSVFITPPNNKDLVERLNGRNTEKKQDIKKRLVDAQGEMAAVGQYDFVIENKDLDLAVGSFMKIIKEYQKERSV
jgi:guanylate kinase